jgi:hypothetical protein
MIPIHGGRSNTLPPLDIVHEREKSAPMQHENGSSYVSNIIDSASVDMRPKTLVQAAKEAANSNTDKMMEKVIVQEATIVE